MEDLLGIILFLAAINTAVSIVSFIIILKLQKRIIKIQKNLEVVRISDIRNRDYYDKQIVECRKLLEDLNNESEKK